MNHIRRTHRFAITLGRGPREDRNPRERRTPQTGEISRRPGGASDTAQRWHGA